MITPLRLHGGAAALLLIALFEPAAAQARPAQTAANTANTATPAAARPAPTSWTTDSRTLAVGDIITLYVDEAVIASARRTQSGRDATGRDMGFALATPGAAATTASFGDSKRATSDQSGDMSRTSALRTTVAMRITARNADGTYTVKGTRSVNVDKNQQEVTVEGVLRSQDVTNSNEADGDRLADAKITVKQKGKLGGTRGGIIGRMLGLLWP